MQGYHSFEPKYLTELQSGADPLLSQSIRQTLDMALHAGADAADIILAESQSQSFKAQSGKISENKISDSRILGIRVQKDERLGISYSESLLENDRRNMVEMAMRNAKFTKEDSSQGIRSTAVEPLFPDCSAQYNDEQIDLAQKEALTLKLESEPLASDDRIQVVPYNGFAENRSTHYVANSNGVFCYERTHGYSCSTSVLMEEGSMKADFGESSMARRFAELDWKSCISTAITEATMLLQAKPIASGNYDVVFTPEALASLLSRFEIMFSGLAAKTRTNPMRDKLGECIASPQLQLLDMPRYRDSLHSQYFDSEGSLPQDLILIENGVLRNFYHNSETAQYFGIETNARAARSAQGSLGTAGNCLVILPDEQASDLRTGEFLEILELNGLHSGCDATSGDFSLPCNGRFYRNGHFQQGVRDVTLAGNFYKMLGQLSAVGNELKTTTGKGFFCPDLRFAGLTIAS